MPQREAGGAAIDFADWGAGAVYVDGMSRMVAIRANNPQPGDPMHSYRYLDPSELADLLGLSTATVTRRAKRRPWMLPPRAELLDRALLRWRVDVVHVWLAAGRRD